MAARSRARPEALAARTSARPGTAAGPAARGTRRALVAVLLGVVAALTGCAGDSFPPAPEPGTSSAAATPSPSWSPGPPVTAAPGAAAFRCDNPVGSGTTTEPGYTAVADAVALDVSRTLELNASDTGPYRYFVKTGLLVRADRPVTLTAPAGTAIAWGNPRGEGTRTLTVAGCPTAPGSNGPWMAYPGGYSVDGPGCLLLEVRTATQRTTMRVPLGRPC